MRSIENEFPFEQLDSLAEQESWRKEVNRPIYHIHKWWANRLGSVFRAILLGVANERFEWQVFYEKHRFSKLTVLDPFMGSGTTVGEALKLGMRAIGCDINPVSTFQVRQALTQVDALQLELAYRDLERTVAPRIQEFYTTVNPATGEKCRVLYFFWVKTVMTPAGEEIPLFGNYIFSRDAYTSRKPMSQILCKHCGAVFCGRFDSRSEQCPECERSFDPQAGPVEGATVLDSRGTAYKIKDLVKASDKPPSHRHYATMAVDSRGNKVYLRATSFDVELYERAGVRLTELDLPLPTMGIRPGHNTDQARGYNYFEWRQCFNQRQLLCLGMLLKAIMEIEDKTVREQLVCLFSSTLEFNNLFCSFKGEGTGAVRHMFANHILKPERQPLENSVWGTEKSSGTFSTLYRSRLLKAKGYLDAPFELHLDDGKVVCSDPIHGGVTDEADEFLVSGGKCALILNGDSANLPLPTGLVDAVVTDPPYFDFVHYSELSDFFYAWLSLALERDYAYFRKSDSSDEGEVQDKVPSEFARNLARVFTECNRCLKDDGLLIFSFHHSRADAWEAIYSALRKSGFGVVAAHPIKAEMSVGSPKAAASDPINLDAILVCRKALAGHNPSQDLLASARAESISLIQRLSQGRRLSEADKRVIFASQALVSASKNGADENCARIMLRTVFGDSKR
jgi:putative DNA methylase